MPKDINNFKDEIQEISNGQIPIHWTRKQVRIERKNYTYYIKSRYKIIDYRKKCIKDLGTITTNIILKFI